jgi:hypothetical protein
MRELRGADLARPAVRPRPRTRPRPRRRCTSFDFEDEDDHEDDLSPCVWRPTVTPPMDRDASTGPTFVLPYNNEVSYERRRWPEKRPV